MEIGGFSLKMGGEPQAVIKNKNFAESPQNLGRPPPQMKWEKKMGDSPNNLINL